MDFAQWLTENGYDAEALNKPENAKQRKHLEAAWKLETAPPKKEEKKEADASGFDDKMQAIEAESQRRDEIRAITEECAKSNVNNSEKLKQLRELAAAALEDTKVKVSDYRLQILRFDRMASTMVVVPKEQQTTGDVLEAAVSRHIGLSSLEKDFDARTLEVSDKQFKRGLSLHGLMAICAKRNGWNGHDVRSDLPHVLRCSFRGNHDGMYAGMSAPSTYSLPNILSNVANKQMRVAFEAVDSAWRQISAIGNLPDFKENTTVALTGALEFEQLGPAGEIKHGDIGEETWTNQLDTYALRLSLDRKTLINDNTGALGSAARRLGRGAALKLNKIFWTEFLNNSAFFTSGNANVSTGAGSALGTADGAAINAAEVIFMNQTDPDGQPVGIMPAIILAPPTLHNTAVRWMGGQLIVTGEDTTLPNVNVYQGRYRVVTSPYMENTSLTGNSTAAWYLLANPMDMPVIETAFLNGQQTPTVETADADFDHLGIMFRGWYDVGANLQEPRAGVRSAGS